MASKIQKTIDRLHQRIKDGTYYEAHQQLRVVASRYISTNPPNYSAAIDILTSGASALLKAKQAGSGGDLCIFLIDIYNQSATPSTPDNKARLLTLIALFPSEEPSRARVMKEAVVWSCAHSEFPAGDPEIHHFIGCIYAGEDDAYEAEKHLLLGTKDSCQVLAGMLYTWYTQDSPHTAGLYAARSVLGYLLLGNVRDAVRGLDTFCSRLTEGDGGKAAPVSQQIETTSIDARIFPTLPLINFLRLLCFTVQRGQNGVDMWKSLRSHYSSIIKEGAGGEWDESLDQLGEMYFGVQIQRQRNFMADMMSSMFAGGGVSGGPPAAAQSKRPTIQQGPAKTAPPPPSENLD